MQNTSYNLQNQSNRIQAVSNFLTYECTSCTDQVHDLYFNKCRVSNSRHLKIICKLNLDPPDFKYTPKNLTFDLDVGMTNTTPLFKN